MTANTLGNLSLLFKKSTGFEIIFEIIYAIKKGKKNKANFIPIKTPNSINTVVTENFSIFL